MPLVSMKPVLEKAYQQQYAVGAFNIFNLNFLEAVTSAAVEKSSPVILNIAEAHFTYVSLEHITPAIRAIAESSDVDIVLNLDHGLTIAGIERAIANGFTNIMFDGSHLDFEENIHQTKEVVNMCQKKSISVEAELGAVGGVEGGALYGEPDPNKYTDVEQAKIFVQETGVDSLAVAIGNTHGKYKGEPDLDFERLETLKEATGIPLVLHGGSGISEEDFRHSISLGISKINFFTGMSQVALAATSDYIVGAGDTYDDYPLMIQKVRQAVTQVVGEQMDIFGSSGKA
ncbi:MAG: ketose 1,6-bisphosphate aldolase [Cyclobacteriaceae bacterium]